MTSEAGIYSRRLLHYSLLAYMQFSSVQNSLRSHAFTFTSTSSLYLAGSTPSSCISLLKNCKTVDQLKQIHAKTFRHGLEQHENILNKLIEFCLHPYKGNFHYAEKVLSYIQKPSLFIYNVFIKEYVKKGHPKRAVFLFYKLRENGLVPDNFTYPFVFKAIGNLGSFHEGMKVHGYASKTGLYVDTYVFNSIMDMYVELGKIDYAEHLFDEMSVRDSVSWNVLISGYVKCSRFKDAVDNFIRMRGESDVRPDEATVVSTLSACTALKMLELGKEIHNYVTEELECSTIISNALLDMYAKCGCLNIARLIFDEMPRKNVICWTSMICGYISCGELEKARELFDRSLVKDIVLWTAMINGYVQFNHVDEALGLFRKMQMKKVKMDKFTVVSLLTGCAQTGALEQGKWIHGYIDENSICIDAVVGTALVDLYAKCGCIDKALDIFYEIRQKDTAAWTSIICGLAMNGKTNEALHLFSEMIQVGFKPDEITFMGVLSACSHGGLTDEGRQFYRLMTEVYSIKPEVEHYGCLIDLLGRAGLLNEAEELIENISFENNEVSVPLYGALLSACRLHRNVEMGERIAKRLMEIEVDDSSAHTLLANIYASANRWDEVAMLRRKMKDRGVRKVPGCSSIEVNGVIHEFLVGDPSHPKMQNICSLLVGMTNFLMGSNMNKQAKEGIMLGSV